MLNTSKGITQIPYRNTSDNEIMLMLTVITTIILKITMTKVIMIKLLIIIIKMFMIMIAIMINVFSLTLTITILTIMLEIEIMIKNITFTTIKVMITIILITNQQLTRMIDRQTNSKQPNTNNPSFTTHSLVPTETTHPKQPLPSFQLANSPLSRCRLSPRATQTPTSSRCKAALDPRPLSPALPLRLPLPCCRLNATSTPLSPPMW